MSLGKRAVAALMVGFPVGAAASQVVGRGGSGHTVLIWVTGLSVGLLVYVIVGLVITRLVRLTRHGLEQSDDLLVSLALLFRPLPMWWQLLRIAASVYFGALAFALMSNALFDPRMARSLGILAGMATASIGMYWAFRPSRS